jgi:hypothetical protein
MIVSDTWREEYRRDRYLEHTNQEEIEQRTRDIFTNVLILDEGGKLTLARMEKGTGFWMRLFTHILEECALRHGGFRMGFLKGTPIPVATWPAIPRAVRATTGRQFEPGKYLFKFGKRKHLTQSLEKGIIRLAPASSYADPSLNYAIRDDELHFTVHVPPTDAWIQKVDEHNLQPVGERIRPLGNVSFTHSVPTDYFVYCLSMRLDFRAFDDFEADACLAIREPKQFVERLLRAGFSKLPDWVARVGPVDYLDPFKAKRQDVSAFFAKHFRYSYQFELRTVWVPKQRQLQLTPMFVELGSLGDIAELITLPPE